MINIHGLKNCDTCRKALKWMDAEGLVHRFHDVRADGIDEPTLRRWIEAVGWEALLNRRGTTWRQLQAVERDGVDESRAIVLMLAHPALIKRPVFEFDGRVIVGFAAKQQRDLGAATSR
jgi:arsenate reductase